MAIERRIGRQLHNPEFAFSNPRVGVGFATEFIGSLVQYIPQLLSTMQSKGVTNRG